ncbi:MAG: DUF2125 domain-containing protein [Rhodobacteraceae bacterium]|nr:DUF2125 domain-containing protein [Paracoccaceae bacterium]
MRILLAVILLSALGWSGYWYFGAQAVERGLSTWLDQRADEGWIAEYASLDTAGFPNRFDTTITELELADPETGVAWSAPFFQILQLSYKPHHVIAVWPDAQLVSTPNQNIEVASEVFRGSIEFVPGPALALSETTVELGALTLVSSADWTGALETGQLSLRTTPAAVNSYDVYFAARNLTLPERIRRMAAQSDLVGDVAETLAVTATVRFTAPWDRRAIEVARPQVTHIDLDLAQGTWGELDLRFAGALEVDALGVPTGEITVKATNWREMLALAQRADLVSPNLAPLIEGGLNMVARLSGNPESIDAPLVFSDGNVSLGGLLPLGPAPLIVLR